MGLTAEKLTERRELGRNGRRMLLPGRLRTTTLGDLLGTIHRAAATGALELVEDGGRTSRIYVVAGRVVAVDLDLAPSAVSVPPPRVEGEGRPGLLARLAVLDALADARVSFRVALPPLDGSQHAPLEPREVLRGRRRARDRGMPSRANASAPPAARAPRSAAAEPGDPGRGPASESARSLLGVARGADVDSIKRAYRRLARAVHPDLHPGATAQERRLLEARFAALTDAYRALVA